MDSWNILLSILLGAIGLGYIVYGRKQMHRVGFGHPALRLSLLCCQHLAGSSDCRSADGPAALHQFLALTHTH